MREEKKKKRKRILSVVLAVTMGMSVLTGCGGGVSENSQSAGTVELKGEYQASPFVQAEINSDTVEWICAAYAVYTQYNHKTLGVIIRPGKGIFAGQNQTDTFRGLGNQWQRRCDRSHQ